MEIEIVDEEENELLERTEIEFVVRGGETPERLSVRDSLAAKLDKRADEVIIEKLGTRFGMNQTLGKAKIYDSSKKARNIEDGYMLERNKIDKEDGEESQKDTEEVQEEKEEETEETTKEEETEEIEQETEE